MEIRRCGAGLLACTFAELWLRRCYGVYPFALPRRGENLVTRFEHTRLRIGDSPLVEGAPEDLRRFAEEHVLVNVSEPRAPGLRIAKAPVAVIALGFVVVFGALAALPLASPALVAALVLFTRCIEADEAFVAIDICMLTLIAARLAIGVALERIGLVGIIVGGLAPGLAGLPPIVALAAVYAIASAVPRSSPTTRWRWCRRRSHSPSTGNSGSIPGATPASCLLPAPLLEMCWNGKNRTSEVSRSLSITY